MEVKTICEIRRLSDYVSHMVAFGTDLGWRFRGQSTSQWPLLPKAGRIEYFLPANEFWKNKRQTSCDLGRFKEWNEQSVAYGRKLPSSALERLALAQHYGLATRLLDWTTNPLVALFFAVEPCDEQDGAVFVHLPELFLDSDTPISDLASLDVQCAIRVRPMDRRIAAQQGCFTYHPHPDRPLMATRMVDHGGPVKCPDVSRFVVPSGSKRFLLRALRSVGVSRRSLFPDLEGLSQDINCVTTETTPRGRAKYMSELQRTDASKPESG